MQFRPCIEVLFPQKISQRIAIVCLSLLAGATALWADWRDDSGFTALAAQYGAALPTGSGITVLHCEATETSPSPGEQGTYLPQQTGSTSPIAGTGAYEGCLFYARSGLTGVSSHAGSVADVFYGGGSVSQGVSHIECYEADHFLGRLSNGPPLQSFQGSVQNHSYVGTTGSASQDEQLLRRYDQMAVSQGILVCVPLNNGSGTTVPEIPSSNYNGICVGLRNGEHSRGGTSVDGGGRMKPDLVVNLGFTSYATPAVASSSVILRERLQSVAPGYNHPLVVKALLLAGASKEVLPQWRRAADTAPYDAVYGAGELHVGNSYRLLESGRQSYLVNPGDQVQPSGWDKATAPPNQARWYYFTVPATGWADTFSVALTWYRTLTASAGTYSSSLNGLTLALYASNDGVVAGSPISQSVSTADNVQHLFHRHLPPGQYALRVSAAEGVTDSTDYALAWQAKIGLGPQTTPVAAEGGGGVTLEFANLDPYVSYTILRSGDLVGWQEVGTFRTGDTTPSLTHQWVDPSPLPNRGFYRIKWNGPRP